MTAGTATLDQVKGSAIGLDAFIAGVPELDEAGGGNNDAPDEQEFADYFDDCEAAE